MLQSLICVGAGPASQACPACLAASSAGRLDKHSSMRGCAAAPHATRLARCVLRCRYKKGYKNIINKGQELNAAGVPCPLMMETSGHGAMRVRRCTPCIACTCCRAHTLQSGGPVWCMLQGRRCGHVGVLLQMRIACPHTVQGWAAGVHAAQQLAPCLPSHT